MSTDNVQQQMVDMALEVAAGAPEADPADRLYGNVVLSAISMLEARAMGDDGRFMAAIILARAAQTADPYVDLMAAMADVCLAAIGDAGKVTGVEPVVYFGLTREMLINDGVV